MIFKNYIKYLYVIFFLILILISINKEKFSITECFAKKKIKIVLAGDSIFDNHEYVIPGSSIEQNLLNNKQDVLLLAKNGSFVSDLIYQIKKMPSNLNTPSTYLFISVGGNDILYKYRDKKFIDKKEINSVFELYKNSILSIKNKFNVKLYLTNVYYPPVDKYTKLYSVIHYWNNQQKKFAQKHNISLFNIDALITDKIHFSNHIEPSEIGSKLIADAITNII